MEERPIETTEYSMSPEPPQESNRRSDERHLTLFRVGTIFRDDQRELCLVKNISAGGALVRVYCSLRVGQPLKIELKEGSPVTGRVNWIRGSDAGIQFDEPVDVPELLRQSANEHPPRMPRVQLQCFGFVRQGAVVHRAVVRNISQGGVSVEVKKPLHNGAAVTVSLPGLSPQHGVVRWASDERFGITFNIVLGLPQLVQWLHDQQGNPPAKSAA